jgi:hypothetical protein
VTETRGWFADLTPVIEAHEVANERHFRRLLLAITAAGAALRIAVLVSKWNRGLLLNDSLWYSGQAQGLTDGHFFQEFFLVSGAEHAPLTSVVIAPASFLPRPEFWQRTTMTAIGIVGIVLIALVARRVGGRRVAIVAAAIAAFYPNIWMGDALIMSETLSLALICVALLAALRYRERMDLRSAVLVGLAVGVAAHARSEVLVYAPLFALIGVRALPWRTWLRTAAPLVAATVVVLIPWTAFNLSRYERPVLMSTNDGTTLLGANCPATYSGPAMGGWILTCLDDDLGRTDEDASQRSARQRREAMAFANQHKTRLPLVAAARVGRALDLVGLDDLIRGDVGEERARWSIWTGIVCWWVLAPLAAVGLWRNRRRFGITLLAPLLGVAITTIVFYGSHRLRAPVEPVVVVGAALFLANIPSIRDEITARLSRAGTWSRS